MLVEKFNDGVQESRNHLGDQIKENRDEIKESKDHFGDQIKANRDEIKESKDHFGVQIKEIEMKSRNPRIILVTKSMQTEINSNMN